VASPDKQPIPMATAAGGTPDKEHQVLADFFNSLIHKDRTPAAAPGVRKSDLTKGLNIPARNPTAGAGTTPPAYNNREDVAKQLERIKNKYQKE